MKEFLLASLFYVPVGSIDTLSTEYGIRNGMIEGNQLMASRPVRISSKGALSLGLAVIDSKSKNKKTKLAMKITWVTLNVAMGAWNIHSTNKYRAKQR